MKVLTSNIMNKLLLLTLLSVQCLVLIVAMPSNVEILADENNRWERDESGKSSGNSHDEHELPVSRRGKINREKFTGRKNDASSQQCGYEVRDEFHPLINLTEEKYCAIILFNHLTE